MSAPTEGTSGYDWLQRFMEAQAGIAGNSMFFTFKLGQIGAAQMLGNAGKLVAREMLADLRTDRDDLLESSKALIGVIDNLLANIERNIG